VCSTLSHVSTIPALIGTVALALLFFAMCQRDCDFFKVFFFEKFRAFVFEKFCLENVMQNDELNLLSVEIIKVHNFGSQTLKNGVLWEYSRSVFHKFNQRSKRVRWNSVYFIVFCSLCIGRVIVLEYFATK
jgi:hypothetical protein